MAGLEDELGIKEKLHIVLRGTDGKIKEEREPQKEKKQKIIRRVKNVTK